MDRAKLTTLHSVILAVGILICCTSGCVNLGSFVAEEDKPPCGEICQIVAAWNNEIVLAPDPYHNGKPNPGIAGRVYLFGHSVDFPRAGDGKITVDLFDLARQTPNGDPVPLERWEFDPVTLRRLLKRDTIGWGYTLFLPWGTYRPDIPVWNVMLKVHYQGANGVSFFTENPATLNKPGGNQTRRMARREALGSMPVNGAATPGASTPLPQPRPATSTGPNG